jgi:hypothetical protein
MRFELLYEHQLPRPWTGESEERLFKDALAQVELADRRLRARQETASASSTW